MGCALAHDLAAAGHDVVVVDRSMVCSGSSGVNAGGVRHQFSSEVNVRTALRSIQRLANFEAEFGVNVGFHQAGYLFLVSSPESRAVFERAVAVQRGCGIPSRFLSPDEIASLTPFVRSDDLLGGAFCSADGYLDPHSVVTAFATAARRHGARFRQGAAVTGFERRGDRIDSVVTSTGDAVSPAVVVNAAGAWAGDIARLAGAHIDITPWRSQVFRIGVDGVPRDAPMTIDFDNGKCYFHPEGTTVVAGNDDGERADGSWPVPFDASHAPVLIERLMWRSEAFFDARLEGGWAGLLELTPDENPIVGWTGADDFYTAAGFSGHGFSLAPGLSLDIARDLAGETTEVALDAYRPDRFDTPAAASEALSLR